MPTSMFLNGDDDAKRTSDDCSVVYHCLRILTAGAVPRKLRIFSTSSKWNCFNNL